MCGLQPVEIMEVKHKYPSNAAIKYACSDDGDSKYDDDGNDDELLMAT